jgi:hypothetical protein
MANIITNPVIIALLAGLVTYLYFVWTAPTIKKQLKKGGKKELVKVKPSMTIPLVVTVAVWLIVYCYQEYFSHDITHGINDVTKIQSDTKYILKKESNSSHEIPYRMMPGVGIPVSMNGEHLPDVFINTID